MLQYYLCFAQNFVACPFFSAKLILPFILKYFVPEATLSVGTIGVYVVINVDVSQIIDSLVCFFCIMGCSISLWEH